MKTTNSIIPVLHKFNRGPQVITPKDAAALVGLTGLTSGWTCLEAGSGSAWLTAFIANIIQPNGKIVSYERDKRWLTVAKQNIKSAGLEKIAKIKKGDLIKAPELKRANAFDLIVLDMKEPELVVPRAARALKPGGFIAVYSPHIEQQIRIITALTKLPKAQQFHHIQTIETIQRPWHVGPGPFTHPEASGILHTGFWTVGRKPFGKIK